MKKTRAFVAAAAISVMLAVGLAGGGCAMHPRDTIVVGSKNFAEQEILGELLAQQIEARTGLKVERRFYLGGTFICQQALLAGRIDVYPEYTGTALTAILKEAPKSDPATVLREVQQAYAQRFHLRAGPPLGFNNTFAMVVRGEDARKLGAQTLSAAVPYAVNWKLGVGYEFLERPDGYEGLVRAYGLKFSGAPRVMDLGLLYRGLLDRQVDMVAANSTDGMLAARDFAVLDDDRHYFPPYEAIPIAREAMLKEYPGAAAALDELAGKISADDMRRMNYEVEGEHREPGEVVRQFRRAKKLDPAPAYQ